MHVRAEQLCKAFQGRRVIEEMRFEARTGFILGLLGPEDSGKTTTMRMLLHIIHPDEGTVTYDDKPINAAIRNGIGYLPQSRGFFPDATLNINLVYNARLKGLSRRKAQVEVVRLLDKFSMIDFMDTAVERLPQEIRMRAELMGAIIHNPDVLIIDEPFDEIDKHHQSLAIQLLKRFRDEGKTVILATRQMHLAQQVCDDVVFLADGRPILVDSLPRVMRRFQDNIICIESRDDMQLLRDIYGVKKMITDQQTTRLYVDPKVPMQKVLDTIIKSIKIARLEINRPDLRDIYAEISNPQEGSA